MANHRFWSKNIVLSGDFATSKLAIDRVEQILHNSVEAHRRFTDDPNEYSTNVLINDGELVDVPISDLGLVIIPKFDMLIPIYDGRLQEENILRFPAEASSTATANPSNDNIRNDAGLSVTICGFAQRAQRPSISQTELERAVDPDRLAALTIALSDISDRVGITGEQLLSTAYAGTTPSRIYRSFVCQRVRHTNTNKATSSSTNSAKNKNTTMYTGSTASGNDTEEFGDANTTSTQPYQRKYPHPYVESLERAAQRTAAQIEFAMRQLRADQAAYLRNTDRPIGAVAGVRDVCVGSDSADSGSNAGINSNLEETSRSDALLPRRTAAMVHPIALVLDNVRSAFNVGSMFRTAETAGAAELVTCGITAHPPHPKLRKTALSAVEVVPSRHFDDVIAAITQLKAEGYTIAVMETTTLSKLYTEVKYPKDKKLALVVGNEVTGVDTRVVEMADMVIEIPMYGIKNSLNVASAAPIVLFEVLRQWHAQ